MQNDLKEILDLVRQETERAIQNWPSYNSAHEAYGVLLEEVDEFWEHVKTNQKKRDLGAMKKEAIQIAAVAVRIALDTCSEQIGRK